MAQLKEETPTEHKHDNTTMKAIICSEYGEPAKVLKLADVPMARAKPNELLIEVYSAALNPGPFLQSHVLKHCVVPNTQWTTRWSRAG